MYYIVFKKLYKSGMDTYNFHRTFRKFEIINVSLTSKLITFFTIYTTKNILMVTKQQQQK